MVSAARGGPRGSPHHAPGSEQLQVRAVYAALERCDFAALRDLAFAKHGFCSAELRRAVWIALLGLSPAEAVDGSWRRLLSGVDSEGQDARVIRNDVQRSVYTWDVHANIRKTARNQKRAQLSEVVHAILQQHGTRLQYVQGFHDIVLVFLEVGTPSQAYHMVERLALFHLSDQLCWPLDRGLSPLLGVLFCLVELLDPPVAAALREAECEEMHFAVPWVLTWFAHSLPRLHEQVMRLFDCLLASHPAAILYFSAALILRHRDAILQAPRELPEMVMILQALPSHAALDADVWVAEARDLMRRVPPEELVARLPTVRLRDLPASTPLLNYPHPWMRRGSGATGGDVNRLAPVYTKGHGQGDASLQHLAAGAMSVRSVRFLRALATRWLGVGGAVAFSACAMYFQAVTKH